MEKGNEVTNIWNAKQRSTNRPLPLHFIDMKPHPTNKEIYQITTLLHMMVTVEAPHVKRAIPQCMRCQKYGHTKNYCRNSPKCEKCAANTSRVNALERSKMTQSNAQTVVTSIQQIREGV